jgi:outer membrane protein with beta-barrel domain
MRMLLPALILAFAGTAAQAADNGFYLGAGVSKSKIKDITAANFDINDTAWKVIAGFRPIDLIAVEANYMDLGSETRTLGPANAHADAKAFTAHALVYLPIPVPFLGVYGKAGLARWELNGDSNVGLLRLDDRGTEFAWGGGAQLSFRSFSARLEYDNFNIKNTNGLDLYTLGFTWTFL